VRPRGLRFAVREDFLYGSNGVVRRGYGVAKRGRTVVHAGGGFWVNARGKRTRQRANGSWTNGRPFWRDGGYRNARGAPTWRIRSGWSNGRGVRRLPYRDRFRLASPDERAPWHAVGVPAGSMPVGAMLRIDALPSQGCFAVTYTLPRGARAIEIAVAQDVSHADLPLESHATALAPDDLAACAG
jgi:hypothetical protein